LLFLLSEFLKMISKKGTSTLENKSQCDGTPFLLLPR
jgi:hypothetical protein